MRLRKLLYLCQQSGYKTVALASGSSSFASKIVDLAGGEVEAIGKILNPNPTIRVTPLKVGRTG